MSDISSDDYLFLKKSKKETKVFSNLGWSLRDFFAGMALQGLITTDKDHRVLNDIQNKGVDLVALYVKAAYRFADAMLEERAKGHTE